jgi:hypothetical protein
MKINLFSFMLAIQKGASLDSEGTSFILSKGQRNHMKLETFHRIRDILQSILQSSQQETRVYSSLDVFKTAKIACWPNKLWVEFTSTATKLSNLIVTTKQESPYELFYGRKTKFGGTFGEYSKVSGEKNLEITDLEESEDEEFITYKGKERTEKVREAPKLEPRVIIKRSKALLDALEESSSSSEDEGEEGNFKAVNVDGDPQSFKEAFHHPDENKRKIWQKGIQKKISSIAKRRVWRVIDQKSIPEAKWGLQGQVGCFGLIPKSWSRFF